MLKPTTYHRFAVLGLAGILLAGCSTGPLDTYNLSALPQAEAPMKRKNVQILVPTPAALKALDSENIVIYNMPGSITYLKGSQWSDRLTNLVQARLVQSFENSHGVGGVGRPGDNLAINYQIQAELREFGIVASSSPQLSKVEMAVRVMNDKTGEVRATRVFSATTPVKGAGNSAYIRALDSAFNTVSAQIVTWVLSEI